MLDIFPLPLPPITQARTRPRHVRGEEQDIKQRAPSEVGTYEKASKNGTDEKVAKPITTDHQASGTHGILAWMHRERRRSTIEQVSSRDLSLESSGLGEMVENARRGCYGPIFMDISSDWFTGIPML